MSKPRSARRDAVPVSPEIRDSETSRLTLIRLISGLAQGLKEQEGSPGRTSSVPVRWEDDFYCYFELEVSTPADCEVDVSVNDGRAFIRIRR